MKQEVIELDGAMGGGQVLRSGLSLSMVTGRALRIKNIRARRSRRLAAPAPDGGAGGGGGLWRHRAGRGVGFAGFIL